MREEYTSLTKTHLSTQLTLTYMMVFPHDLIFQVTEGAVHVILMPQVSKEPLINSVQGLCLRGLESSELTLFRLSLLLHMVSFHT